MRVRRQRHRYSSVKATLSQPYRYLDLCVPTLSELRRHSANTQVVQRLSGKIQTGHTPPSVETPTDLRWQTTLSTHSLARARFGSISDIRDLVSYTNTVVKELQFEACVHREWTGYVFPLFWWLRDARTGLTRGTHFFST
jgi:hypothetical protein